MTTYDTDRDLYMAVVIIVNPNMISSIPSQKYVIFMYKKSKSLVLCTQQSFFTMAFIINCSFPFIWSWKAKKRMGNKILFRFSFEMIQLMHFSLSIISHFFQYRLLRKKKKKKRTIEVIFFF